MKSTWTKRSEEELLRLSEENVPNIEIAKRLRRSVKAIEAKLHRLRNPATKRRGKKPTTPSQELRDWFAGMAIMGLLANSSYELADNRGAAELSYDLADAMIDERAKRNETKG